MRPVHLGVYRAYIRRGKQVETYQGTKKDLLSSTQRTTVIIAVNCNVKSLITVERLIRFILVI